MLSTQVLIIGAGPVGMITALCLAKAEISCVLIDRHKTRRDAPKAHAVNPRTLEICERLGLSADHIRSLGASYEDGGKVHFMDTLSSTCFGALPYERQDDGARAFTPWPLVNIPQPVFEQCLETAVEQDPNITFLQGVTATAFEQTDSVVTVAISGSDSSDQITAEYVVAADGAGSQSREILGIGMTGPEALQHHMMIHFEANLRELTQDHPGLLYFCLSPTAQGVFIGYDREKTWVFMQSYNPLTQSREDFDDAECKRLVCAAAGVDIPDLVIKNVSPWTMSAQVADTYRTGRVFLAGDAAHRFPPTGGLGLNTGVADAENLAWKLSLVLKNDAHHDLLDSYEAERRPVAQINSQQSMTNSAKMLFLFSAVHGTDLANTAAHYASVCAAQDEFPAVAEAVEIQRPHFDSFNLQIGYQYGVEVDADSLDISRYEPTFLPGDYLPLTQLVDAPWLLGRLSQQAFSLITGPAGEAWRCTPLDVLIEGEDFIPLTPFFEQAGIEESGALLIRPDGHIAARWSSAPPNPEQEAQSVIDRVLQNTNHKEH